MRTKLNLLFGHGFSCARHLLKIHSSVSKKQQKYVGKNIFFKSTCFSVCVLMIVLSGMEREVNCNYVGMEKPAQNSLINK